MGDAPPTADHVPPHTSPRAPRRDRNALISRPGTWLSWGRDCPGRGQETNHSFQAVT
ncbi:hypothetical protein AKJ09_01940 [Labilithrix luteola]|uniref:Uncharacterized protein n=1 Tax=Labilithrix luteola TaxID=1391654 RepID=A0A0K1PPG4_9BACT|nr:hypothetical protein AKJ09_01940 [Labilithrix luteola]